MMKFEPMSLGMILDYTFKIYFRNFLKLFGLSAIPQIFGVLAIAAVFTPFAIYFYAAENQEEVFGAAFGLMFLGFFIGYFFYFGVVLPVTSGSVVLAVSKIYLGEEFSFVEIWKAALRRWPTLFWSMFVLLLLVSVGFIFCIVPGIYLYVCYALIVPVVILEQNDSPTSRSRAWSLSEGMRLEIFVALFVFWLIKSMVQQGASFMQIFFPENLYVMFGVMILALALTVVLQPLTMICIALLYYNARISKDGFDLEMLAREVIGESVYDSPAWENLPGGPEDGPTFDQGPGADRADSGADPKPEPPRDV